MLAAVGETLLLVKKLDARNNERSETLRSTVGAIFQTYLKTLKLFAFEEKRQMCLENVRKLWSLFDL